MNLSAVIDAMLTAGCSAEQMAAVVRAYELEREYAASAKRAKDAERQRRSRMSRDVTVTGCDNADKKAPPFSPLSLSPTPPIPNPPISPQKSPQGARGSRLPRDWQPSQADTDFALDTGWTVEHVRIEASKFRDYWIAQPGQKGVKLDWPATWRNWVRRNLPSTQNRPPGNRQENYREIGERLLKEMRNERSESESTNRVIDLFPAVSR